MTRCPRLSASPAIADPAYPVPPKIAIVVTVSPWLSPRACPAACDQLVIGNDAELFRPGPPGRRHPAGGRARPGASAGQAAHHVDLGPQRQAFPELPLGQLQGRARP